MNLTRIALLFALAGAVLSSGCVSTRNDVSQISAELNRRSGLSLTNVKPGEVTWPATVSFEDGLSEDEAVTLALRNNAAFQETLADLGVSRADLVQAGMLPNPTLSMLVPWGAKGLEFTAKYPLEVLWLRPKRIGAAKRSYEQTVQRLTQAALDLIRDAKLSFADVILAQERVHSAEQTVAVTATIGQLSKARLDAGDASELELSTARADGLQAEELLVRARQDLRIASERLRALIGMGLQPFPQNIVESQLLIAAPDMTLLVTNALSVRPDLHAAELGIESAGKRIGLARLEAFTLAAGVNAKDVNGAFLAGPSLDFAVPIVNQNQGGIALAKANFEKAARHYYTVRDKIVLEVRESHLRFAQAIESLDKWQKQILPPLEAAVRQAQKAYEIGEASLLLVLDNTRRLEDARAKAAVARADTHRAAAELERSVGGRLGSSSIETTNP